MRRPDTDSTREDPQASGRRDRARTRAPGNFRNYSRSRNRLDGKPRQGLTIRSGRAIRSASRKVFHSNRSHSCRIHRCNCECGDYTFGTALSLTDYGPRIGPITTGGAVGGGAGSRSRSQESLLVVWGRLVAPHRARPCPSTRHARTPMVAHATARPRDDGDDRRRRRATAGDGGRRSATASMEPALG